MSGLLYGSQQTKSPTQKPDSMPALNDATRGAVVGVSFGSNRLRAKIGWNKNFAAIRQQASGKGGGKGGGSGGFGSMKGGDSAAQSYIYKWDLMYNFGILDKPSYIRIGWIGGDRIDRENLNTLTGGDTDLAILAYGHTLALPNEDFATLTYDGAHVARGYGTGDVNLTSWPYFQAQEGVDCAFPYNAWIGFQQLNLGQSPSVPQLSCEFVPIPANEGFDVNASFASTVTSAGEGTSTLGDACSAPFIHGADDKHYWIVGGNGELHFVCVEDGTHLTLNDTQFQADLTTKGMTPPTGTAYTDYIIGAFNIPCGGTAFAWVVGEKNNSGFGYMGIRYKINASSALEIDGGLEGQSDFITDGADFNVQAATVIGTNVVAFGTNISGYKTITLPLSGDVVADVANWTALFTDFTPSGSFFDYILLAGRGGFFGCVVAQPDNSYKILTYIGVAEYDYISTHVSHSTAWASVTAPGVYLIESGDVVFLDGFSVDDAGQHHDGTDSANINDDYTTGLTSFIQNSVTHVALTRGYSSTDDNTPTGSFARCRLFTWDGSDAAEVGDLQGSMFDTVSDIGLSEANRYSIDPPSSIQMYLDENNNLRYVWIGFAATSYRRVFGTFATDDGLHLDVTPAYIVYRIITSDVFGFATNSLFGFTITPERINQDSYVAADQWCRRQGIRVSIEYVNASNVLSYLAELLTLFNGFLTDLGGTVYFNYVTGEETPERTIDNSHLVADAGRPPVKITKAAQDDSFNVVQFQYLDRTLEYNTEMVEASDEVDMDQTGPRIKQYQPSFTMAGSLAAKLATRALWQNRYAKDTYDFKLGWKDADLHPGALITLVDSFDQTLVNGVRARIIDWKVEKRGQFTVTAKREFPYIMSASAEYTQTTSINGGFGSIVQSPAPMLDFRAYELPKEFQTTPKLYFGYNQSFYNMGAKLYISHDGANYVLTQDVQPYIISGLFPNTLEQRPQGYAEDFVDFYLFPTSQTSSPNFVFDENIDDVSQALRAAGAGVFIVGSEAVAVENLTLRGQNHYRARRAYRGWGGTPITAHPANALWHYHAAGIFAHDIALDDIGTTISYKILGYNFAGQEYDLSSVDARTYTIKGDYWLPRAQARSRMYVQSAQAWPASVEIGGPYIGVTSGGCDVVLTWPNQANDEGYGAGGYGGGTYGHFAADSLGWRVDVSSKNGTKVSSFLANTPYFGYNRQQNSADFNGFAHDLIFTVTPYTVKGDGPVANTRSLSMNW